ncbi:MAG: FAD-binding oxidoreductase [Pseudomonadota bacterium]
MKDELVWRFVETVGEKNALLPSQDLTHYTHENRDMFVGKTPAVLKPGSTEEVSRILSLASETGTAVVPQGGHTGHVGGAVPDETGKQIVVSLERMNRIREIDLSGNALVCEAGCILEAIQKVADDNDRLFPLALGSQGSCQIGGNISTNAGGTAVLSYGNTRQLVLGLEVVLPSGEIWDGLRRLKKDNTGYDLKDLFIGAEGTLGIITAAVLKLFPCPKGKSVALCGLETPQHALELFERANHVAGQSLTAFELMARNPVEFTVRNFPAVKLPLQEIYPWQVLIEVSSNRSEEDASSVLQPVLEEALGAGVIIDASIASSIAQQKGFWQLRETMPVAQKNEGGSMKHDVSVPIHKVPEFLSRADHIIKDEMPHARICAFGHMGDGNMHYNISQPVDADAGEFLSRQASINDMIHDLVIEMEGSVAAEHGVGRLKRKLLLRAKSEIELQMFRSIKEAFDPNNLMNPGKLI